ncbi:MAPEG family protein [Shewanella sp. 1CM18E]|uniref:MAPEG family protein n=1 Tax=Shewanella sp. 1CM18E TaxID=2929169 RepID=UPI0020BD65D5|nr:MAPEG family protein [Shewanella sp. 1CM18E]MCK8046706.1 MAPEG family protein [Shewanella sp. 1CM18E]
MEFIEPYRLTVLVLGLSGALFWLQLAIVDIVGIRAKHTPGFGIEQDHNQLLFRANRALANSNESIGILLLFVLFAILSNANPNWLNDSALAYFIGRALHMLCYYLNIKVLRSIAFGVSFSALLAMFIVGLLAWIQ